MAVAKGNHLLFSFLAKSVMGSLRPTRLIGEGSAHGRKGSVAEPVQLTAADAKPFGDLRRRFISQESQHRLKSSVLFRGYGVC